MKVSKSTKISPKEHIETIFKSFSVSSRVLESFTNLSNTVIDTALSGQNKFVFEILQNADDSCNDPSKTVAVQFILRDDYFIIQHNGKEFDFLDVERICDFASQIKEVKTTDLSKTGYKGLGFKSLFNISKCIYICSGGYSFRFDKSHWSNAESKPWQVIPIWSKGLPLSEIYKYDEPVNFILRVKKAKQLEKHLIEVLEHPEFFLYLRHVDSFRINLYGKEHLLERKVEDFGSFAKYNFYKNQSIVSTWLSRTFQSAIPTVVQTKIQKGSKYTYPDKIKEATEVPIAFTIEIDEMGKEIKCLSSGFCFNTLPTQLQLTLPYHVNSFFILNLDRTQLDENDFNEFIFEQIGYLQLNLLKDLATVPHLKNFLVKLFSPKIYHSYSNFNKAFSRGLSCAKNNIAWLPAQEGSHLLKLGEAWIDEIKFFKSKFKDVRDEVSRNIIDYDVIKQYLLPAETKRFTYNQLFNDFSNKYYSQLTEDSYMRFIRYLYKNLKNHHAGSSAICKLKDFDFLRTKNGTLTSPKNALLEDSNNSIPNFSKLNPIDNKYLPLSNSDELKHWLGLLGAKRLKTPINILRESLLKWIDYNSLDSKINTENHIDIINYVAKNSELLTKEETKNLKENLLVLTESKEFKLMKTCYLPEAIPIKELEGVISDEEKIIPVYDMHSLKCFIIRLGIHNKLTPINLLRKSILEWIKTDEVKSKLTVRNYTALVEYFASQYSKIEENLTQSEKSDMKKMPVLTCVKTFKKTEHCYFDYVIPDVPGFECAIPKEILVSSKNISRNGHDFLVKVGVSKQIEPTDIIRKTVLKWIQEDTIKTKINLNNHQRILSYIAETWGMISGFQQCEKNNFRMFPILTKSNTFKEAHHCYWQTDGENIPNIESIISCEDYVSSEYTLPKIKELLNNEYFGVRSLKFEDICEKYCSHLTDRENIKWFFFHLIYYWEQKSLDFASRLLTRVKGKLCSSYLLAKNGRLYLPTELYSSRFCDIHIIDPNCLPILDYKIIPEDLENFLGFKTDLDMPCIMKLLEGFGKEQKKRNLNEGKTLAFFTALLEQLRRKNRIEIGKYTLKLLSNANELKSAKELYYFQEENAKCTLHEHYLKRICGMSHKDTLELAILCGVCVIPFHIDASFENKKYTDALKAFYLQRLPFIVLKESKERKDPPLTTLRNLYGSICLIELIECENIYIKYPFGDPVNERRYFDDLKIYVVDSWRDHNSHIHKHIKEKLFLKADIGDIVDMQSISQKKKKEFLQYEKEDPQIFYEIEKEIQKNFSGQENINTISNETSNSLTEEDVTDNSLQNIDSRQEQTPYSNKLTLPSKQSNITVDQKLSEFKSDEYFEDLRNFNVESGSEQKIDLNTHAQFGGQANKITFNEQPSDGKTKQVIADTAPRKLDIDSAQQQRSKGIFNESLVPNGKKNLNKHPYDSRVDKDCAYPLLGKLSPDSRQEQTPYSNTFALLSRRENRTADQKLSESISDKYVPDLSLHNVYSRLEQATHANTLTQCWKQANKTTFNEQPSDSVAKNVIPEPFPQKLDMDATQEQKIPGSSDKVFLTPESKRNSDKYFSDSKANKVVAYSILQKPKVDFRKKQISDSNTLRNCSGQENKRYPDAQPYAFEKNKDVTNLLLPKFEVRSKEEETFNAPKRTLWQESKKTRAENQRDSKSDKNVSDSSLQKFDVESEHKNVCDGIKEFYLEILPFIVIRESKNLNKSPFVILNRLYKKIASIESIQYNRMNRKPDCNVPVNESCYFNGLKIYVPGQWTDYKTEIHQHIIQELCLNSNVADIIGMEMITENSKKDWIHFHKENLQTLHRIEEVLRTLLRNSTELNEKESSGSLEIRNVQVRDNNIPYKVIANHSRKTSTSKHGRQHSMKPNSNKNGSFFRHHKNERVPECERKNLRKYISSEVKVNGNDLNLKECQAQAEYRVIEQDMPGSSQENLQAETSHVLPVLKTEKSNIQRLNEIYVFTFLQDYYKRKYPNARCTLSDDYFQLKWESHEIVIMWANAIEDTDGLFDLSLKKDGEFNKFIEVQSINAIADLININHRVFLNRSGPFGGLFQERQSFREKFRIYCLVSTEDSTPSVEVKNKPLALYKIKPLKLFE